MTTNVEIRTLLYRWDSRDPGEKQKNKGHYEDFMRKIDKLLEKYQS